MQIFDEKRGEHLAHAPDRGTAIAAIGINGCCCFAQLLYATDNPAGDFTPVGNENAVYMRFDRSARYRFGS